MPVLNIDLKELGAIQLKMGDTPVYHALATTPALREELGHYIRAFLHLLMGAMYSGPLASKLLSEINDTLGQLTEKQLGELEARQPERTH